MTVQVKVVSLLPSATEMIALLRDQAKADGSGDIQLVGRSHECDWPEDLTAGAASLTASKIKWTDSKDVDRQVREALADKAGSGRGLYTVDRELLARLAPGAIVTQSLCEVCSVDFCQVEDIAAGLDPRPLVVDLNPRSLQEVLGDVRRVGGLLGVQAAGDAAADALQARVDGAVASVPEASPAQRPSVAMLEWVDPIFMGGHWTPQLVEMAGGRHPMNPCKDGGGAANSTAVPTQALADSHPDWVIVALCGLDLPTTRKELDNSLAKDPLWAELPAVKAGRVVLVDGNQMFNRPGPRLVDALEFLVGLLHARPAAIPSDFPWQWWRAPPAGWPAAEAAAAAEA